jgi:hypothetical protein
MLQESTSWDLQSMRSSQSTEFNFYVLFLLVACIVTSVKLVGLWIAAPPFQIKRQVGNAGYLHLLAHTRNSLKQWMALTLVICGLFTSISAYKTCNNLLAQKIGSIELFFSMGKSLSTALSMCSLVMLFILLIRWHVMKRIEQIDDCTPS